jgi:hypothetical protein
MMEFIIWFAVLLGIVKVTRGWGRALALVAYVVGSVLVAL